MKRFVHYSVYLYIICFLSSCAGYHFSNSDNPLAQFGIKSIAVPMFINETPVAGVSPIFTKDIVRVLSRYSGLKVYSGEKSGVDAILVGIITSPKKVSDFLTTASKKYVAGDLENSIGNRNKFYLPHSSTYSLMIDFVLIKDPSIDDIKLASSGLRKSIHSHPRIIVKDSISLSGSFTRNINSNESVDDGGVVNSTQNQAFFKKSLMSLSKNASIKFEEVILNAF